MATMILDPGLAERIIAERAACGGDRFDEVWEGTYMMSPLADNEHQNIQFELAAAINTAINTKAEFKICCGANVSDRKRDWKLNYRCPDVVVLSPNTKAKDCGAYWYGGPDFCVEITSPHDRSRDKFEFYAKVGVRELLLIDRRKWTLELYELADGCLQLAGTAQLNGSSKVQSSVLGLTFGLVPGKPRPKIKVATVGGKQSWLA
jgi:Uma2 family endonuclease